jgi:hypothetical protein
MAITVMVALIVLGAAVLMGLTVAARRRGFIGPGVAVTFAMALLLVGGSTMLYPSLMIVDVELGG